MLIIKYKNGKFETTGSSISPLWFASKLQKNGGIECAYEIMFEEFIKENFEELEKSILKKYKIKQGDHT